VKPRELVSRLPKTFPSTIPPDVRAALDTIVASLDTILRNLNDLAPIATKSGNVLIGSDNIENAQAKGFLYIPRMNGIPTGVPTNYGGSPILHDFSNKRLWVYDHATPRWYWVALT
jgi:hypothetical protein